jgi:hypothetical protein
VYQSLFQSSSIKQHLLDAGPVHAGFYLISRQFTNLHTLSIDCQSKGCVDYEHLPLLPALRRLRLCQFSFTEDALAAGVGRCSGLQVLQLEGQQVRRCDALQHCMHACMRGAAKLTFNRTLRLALQRILLAACLQRAS